MTTRMWDEIGGILKGAESEEEDVYCSLTEETKAKWGTDLLAGKVMVLPYCAIKELIQCNPDDDALCQLTVLSVFFELYFKSKRARQAIGTLWAEKGGK